LASLVANPIFEAPPAPLVATLGAGLKKISKKILQMQKLWRFKILARI
jgi:hypothetical protein